ncbi:MAG: radical SAM protein [Candidatus Nanoarchaeia archaeon]
MEKINLPERYDYISVFLTFRCNLNCNYCVNNASGGLFKREGYKEISGKEWVEILNNIESKKDLPISFVGGEPSLHKDFIYIINNLDKTKGIDILTNLWWDEKKVSEFIQNVDPKRIDNHAPFPSIRASYHPLEMQEGEKLLENTIKLKNAGFDIGLECVMYPSAKQLEALERMAIKCRARGISFRPKSFIGKYEGKDDNGNYFSITYGNYSKYPGSTFSDEKKSCKCKTSNLLISPSGEVYRCQRDLLLMENSLGSLLDPNFKPNYEFTRCTNYGECHPCDVKVKTDSKQRLGTTLSQINEINE